MLVTQGGYKAMTESDLARYYLIDSDEAMRGIITRFLNRVMRYEATHQIQARPYERTENRNAHRNGIKKRSLNTKYGKITLDKPQFREYPFETQVITRYSRAEKSLHNAIVESYLQGVSTRRIQKVVSQLGADQVSASAVSRIAKELDEAVDEFLKRPIEARIRYLFVDASYFKIRCEGQYINKALFVATGIREDGYREILGAKTADNEGDIFWSSFFDDLKERGLEGVQMVVSDGHKGIQKAVQTSFLGASWQMCNVHFQRAVLKGIKKKDLDEIAGKLKDAMEDEAKMQKLAEELSDRNYSKAAETIERFIFDLWNYKVAPREHWKKIRTTNVQERLNKELKRRSRVAGAFPNDPSFLRLAVSILIDINEEWMTGNRYLSIEDE
jgi:putative transposase